MYYPYFRGKQFELITIRETASTLVKAGFVPVIEPVRQTLGGLERTLAAICNAGGKAIVIVNPYHGDHSESGVSISTLLKDSYYESQAITAGILLRSDMSLDEATKIYGDHKGHNPTIVHSGFTAPKDLAEFLGSGLASSQSVFIEDYAKTLYRKHFDGSKRILVRDGFKRMRNADYPELEEFSDLHVTFPEVGMNGFGDFLTVGDSYSESGGPAYAVAIHLTFIDQAKDDVMYIYHFVSTTKDTPTDPAGKFGQALQKLMDRLNSGNSQLAETSAIEEFREFHKKGHFPGLGYIKKLSMKHHIETLALYLS